MQNRMKIFGEYMWTKMMREILRDAANVMEKETHLLEDVEDEQLLTFAALNVAISRHSALNGFVLDEEANTSRLKKVVALTIKNRKPWGKYNEMIEKYRDSERDVLAEAIVAEFEKEPSVSNMELADILNKAFYFI